MTAYSRACVQSDWGQAIWECRAVNHRYLDLSFKMPESFREWEIAWRKIVGKYLERGKVECYLHFIHGKETAPDVIVNMDLVEKLISSCEQVSQYPGVTPSIASLDLLRWPGALQTKEKELRALQAPLEALLEKGLIELVEVRQREGKALSTFILEGLEKVLAQLAIAQERLPQCYALQKEKVQKRMTEMAVSADKDRVEQELVFYAQRIDAKEEIERLTTHVKEVQRALEKGGVVGRRLDFLMQEMNREANTLGSKSLDTQVTQAAVELKVLIEQMREQIQNVE